MPIDLRPGQISSIYYKDILVIPSPNQLTVLHELFPGLVVEIIPSDGSTKKDADYDDVSGMIRAYIYHGKLYTGYNNRVSQITARLMGMARSGIEKERRTASDIQIRIAKELCEDSDLLFSLWNGYLSRIENWPEDTIRRAVDHVFSYAETLSGDFMISAADDELFPMDQEVTAELMARVTNRLDAESEEGFLDAWL